MKNNKVTNSYVEHGVQHDGGSKKFDSSLSFDQESRTYLYLDGKSARTFTVDELDNLIELTKDLSSVTNHPIKF